MKDKKEQHLFLTAGMIDILFKVRELVDKATNIVMNYTETEAKVMLLNTHKKYTKHIAFFHKGSRGNK